MADTDAKNTKTPQMTAYSSDARGRFKRGRRPERSEEEKQFDERVVNIDRVARVVSGGRRFRFRALVIVGDRKGQVGMGIAKGADVTTAVQKAVDTAKKNFQTVVVVDGTIPHEAQAKVGGANILIKPAAPGTGLIAGGTVRTILETAGVSNVLSKSIGSSNKINVAYATLKALEDLKHPNDWLNKPVSKSNKKAETISSKTTKKVTKKLESKK